MGKNSHIHLVIETKFLDELKKQSYIEKYLPYVGEALQEILDLSKAEEQKVEKILKELLEKSRGMD